MPKPENDSRCADDEILFATISHSGQRIPNVKVLAIKSTGATEAFADTGEFGESCYEKSQVFGPQVICLTFCREGLHCTALFNQERWRGFKELPIVLAPFILF